MKKVTIESTLHGNESYADLANRMFETFTLFAGSELFNDYTPFERSLFTHDIGQVVKTLHALDKASE